MTQVPSDKPDLGPNWGDTVPPVNPADLRQVCHFFDEMQARHGGALVDHRAYEHLLSPGADPTAVWYRAAILGVLKMLPDSPLAPWLRDGNLDDTIFQIAATFPMEEMEVGVPRNTLPFDLTEFLKQLDQLARPAE